MTDLGNILLYRNKQAKMKAPTHHLQ